MWRTLGALVAVLALAGLTLSHATLQAQGRQVREGKQLVCHVPDSLGTPHIIEISENAVPAHLRNHGDCLINSTERSLKGQPCDPTDADGNDICDIQP
jgi:hypothetical protein